MIELRGAGKVKEGRKILENISFKVEKEEFFMILGESGSGKTTLLRLINRLEEATTGEILIEGRSIREVSPVELRRKVVMIFQESRLFEGTVEHNLALAPRYHDLPVDVQGLLESVGLKGYESRDVATLSGGEKQRVAIARALALKPRVILMDEPTSALDDASEKGIENLINEIKGITVLFVTHDREQAMRLGGRGIILDKGKKLFEGIIGDAEDV